MATSGNKVETTPITNIGDLLVAKAPGVVVLPGPMTGSAPIIRIRGLNSLATNGSGISNAPIYIVDGVHIGTGNINLGTGGTQASFLNDLDPNEIEDVEIVKGPSAATLYGTNASNGVIVITTKRGRAGSTKWTWYGEGGGVSDRNSYPTTYASWGHDSTNKLTRCTLVSESQKGCFLDSLTSYNVLMNPVTSPLHLGHHDGYGMNASGGSDQVRFFVSGDLGNETGPIFMPQFARRTLDSLGTPAKDEWINPEAYQQYSMRANLSASFSPKFDFNANAGFSNLNQRIPQTDNNTFSFIYSALNNPGFNHDGPASSAGLGYTEAQVVDNASKTAVYRNGYGGFSPAQTFQLYNTNGTQRFIGSGDATWRPFSWMNNQATAGVDLADNVFVGICRFAECPNSGTLRQGRIQDTQTNLRNFTGKITSNMTWQATQSMNFKTTLGGEYGQSEQDGVNDSGTNLPPGAQTVNAAAVVLGGNTLQTTTKILGYYAQEQASIRDRLFLVVAARTDQNSAFGTKYQRVIYPKASVSYIISDESFFPHFDWLNQLRLRGAYGASGNQPGSTVALQTFQSATANIATAGGVSGTDTPGLAANALGNALLKPERSTETELGFETSVLNNRAHFDFTYYSKSTKDALVAAPIAASSGASTLSVVKNLGGVGNSGIEATLTTTLIDRRELGWDLTLSGSHNSNKINSIGVDATGKPLPTIGTGTTRDSIGASVNGFFARPFTYADANGDGIITPNEVTVGPNFAYYGYSQPRDIFSISNGFDFFNRKLHIQALLDYKGGGILYNQSGQFYSQNFATWYSSNLTSTTLADQARTVANLYGTVIAGQKTTTVLGYLENDQYWKLREVSAALTLPNSVANKIRARDAQIVFSARNLHTWTSYTGTDPEAGYLSGTGDVQNDFSTIAPRAYFLVRANLHY